jgi:hypothetical protein
MFKKIDSNFIKDGFDWEQFRGELVAEFVSGTSTLSYYSIRNPEAFRAIHTRNIFGIRPDKVMIATISGTGFLAAHVDHNTLVTLNHYISANADITTFYEPMDRAEAKTYEGKEQANVYALDDLVPITNFVSNSGDTFLLDVSKIHSVEKVNSEQRVFIAYGWTTSTYEQVLAGLK